MSRLDRYLARYVIFGSLGGLFVLVALDTFFAFIGEISRVGQGDYAFEEAGFYILLTIPMRFYELSPTGVLIGALMSLGALAANSEMIAMRAAGISVRQIAEAVLKAGLVLVVLVVVIGEFLAPQSLNEAQHYRAALDTKGIKMQGREGVWARDNERLINVRRVLPGQHIQGILVYEMDGERLRSVTVAKEAHYDAEQDVWLVKQVRSTLFSQDKLTTRFAKEESWPRLLSPDLFDVIVVKPEQMSALDLKTYIDYLHNNRLDAAVYELAFWVHFTTPLSTLVMLLLALPFLFGSQRQGNAGNRLFIGVLLGLGFYLFSRSLNHLGIVYGLSPVLSAFLPLMLFLAGSIYRLKRVV